MEDDWDLQAVVRGCTTTSSSSYRNSIEDLKPCFSPSLLSTKQDENPLFFPNSFQTRRTAIEEELHELYKPFFPKSQSLSPLKRSIDQFQHQSKQSCDVIISAISQNSSRSKRRKKQLKKVCQVPAEGLSSDTWSWRKYGQKPIKGSPYPRGYYRCSSSKGCLARKQVERNRSDPSMFIITYTAEHNHPVPTHRNSLAGTTRDQKILVPPQPSSIPTTSMEDEVVKQSMNRYEDNFMEDGDDENEFGFSDLAVTDDFFEGLDEIAGSVAGDDLSGHLPASFSLPWMSSNAAAAAGAGGS